ncbi:protein phosphatase methylesterase 1-like isoform X2 [Haliotis asinina]|uniref:protein phosphatase methylesterase 1-like isoform X2 n=1 Tax=Haliotis asinina TaxID=109174 RepID=UPI003531D506
MSALGKEVMKKRIGLPPMPTAGPSNSGSSGRRALMRKRDYTPVYWDKYFEKMHDVETDIGNIFRVYECGTEGPVLLFLHGGGFSALSWAVLSCDVSHLVTCRCAALDLRGHGDSMTSDDTDLSADTMAKDVGDVVTTLYGEDPPPIILVGHSMGGAISVHAAVKNLIPSLIGLCVIDVVEGTALDALNSMQSFLRGRPKSFRSLEQAIEWVVRTGQIRNVDSARVSMVGQVKRSDTNETASSELEHMHEESPTSINSIQEEDEGEAGAPSQPALSPPQAFVTPPQSKGSSYTWRIDLSKTEQFWKGWFEGLSQKFLSCPVPKMLLLAGVDRLDKDLTIGQMQGKFQMQVLPQSGHAVHEDCPDRVAEVLATFMVRHKVATPTTNFERSFPAC